MHLLLYEFQAMRRILVGLCQVGAWGCFDEFNRLEERILSAVSQQVQFIQEALKELANPKQEKSESLHSQLMLMHCCCCCFNLNVLRISKFSQ